jgi:hypothetical protein
VQQTRYRLMVPENRVLAKVFGVVRGAGGDFGLRRVVIVCFFTKY